MDTAVLTTPGWSASLLLAVGAMVAAFVLLLRWLAGLLVAVPQENREYRDPPPAYWRWIGLSGATPCCRR